MNAKSQHSFMPGCRWAYFDETHVWLTKCCKEHVKFRENPTTGSAANMVTWMEGCVLFYFVKTLE